MTTFTSQSTWRDRLEAATHRLHELGGSAGTLHLELLIDKVLKAAGMRELIEENAKLRAQIAEIRAETKGWVEFAREPEERGWAGTFAGLIERALERVG